MAYNHPAPAARGEGDRETAMSAIDAGVVFLPRLTTLVGDADFATAPLDVSRQGGAQFQVWRGPIRVSSGSGTLTLHIEESFDAQSWSLGPATVTTGIVIQEAVPHFFSYSFRLRWFRLRFVLAGTNPMVSCWAEGLLRGGGEGMWGSPMAVPGLPHGMVAGREPPAPWWARDADAARAAGGFVGGVLSTGVLDPRDYPTRGAWEIALRNARAIGWSGAGMPELGVVANPWGPVAPPAAPPVAPPIGPGP